MRQRRQIRQQRRLPCARFAAHVPQPLAAAACLLGRGLLQLLQGRPVSDSFGLKAVSIIMVPGASGDGEG
jgi:hypothetical protein